MHQDSDDARARKWRGRGVGEPCSSDCATEFGHCTAEGPGYDDCLKELRAGTGTLGSVCDAGVRAHVPADACCMITHEAA